MTQHHRSTSRASRSGSRLRERRRGPEVLHEGAAAQDALIARPPLALPPELPQALPPGGTPFQPAALQLGSAVLADPGGHHGPILAPRRPGLRPEVPPDRVHRLPGPLAASQRRPLPGPPIPVQRGEGPRPPGPEGIQVN